MPLKIAMIGAGSVGFTRRLLQDILTVPELSETRFSFTDVSQHNMDMVTQLCLRDIEANGLGATVSATTNRRAALADADYVLCTIRQGGLEAFQTDIDIPLKYGVDPNGSTFPTGSTARPVATCVSAPKGAAGLSRTFPTGCPAMRPSSPPTNAARSKGLIS